jgi:hypothetical protein
VLADGRDPGLGECSRRLLGVAARELVVAAPVVAAMDVAALDVAAVVKACG